jgi:NAD(P)-dependent dehydrogenase (short-subunit alcohol dehydrogenase family)
MDNFRTVLITGASSGIGASLAKALARPGTALHLSGRDQARLAAVAAPCRERGAIVETKALDVRHAGPMTEWIEAVGPLDLVVANAGISGRTRDGGPEPAELTRTIFDVNLGGVVNTVLPAIAVMARQPPGRDGIRGRIAALASIAAFLAAPDAPAYCASKAAVDGWMVASAPEARRHGVLLTSICPGFIRTPMTAENRFPMPGLMDADRAAGIILRGVAAGRMRVVFPGWMGLAARAAGLLPPGLISRVQGQTSRFACTRG